MSSTTPRSTNPNAQPSPIAQAVLEVLARHPQVARRRRLLHEVSTTKRRLREALTDLRRAGIVMGDGRVGMGACYRRATHGVTGSQGEAA